MNQQQQHNRFKTDSSLSHWDGRLKCIYLILFLSPGDFFLSKFFFQKKKKLQEHYRSQMVWIQNRTHSVGPDMGLNCLQMLSADAKSRS